MQYVSFERARPTPGRCLRTRSQTLRRASLLIGTSFLLQAAPAWAANECGPPPPGGGTVTCPAGEYPNGIDYATPSDLEIRLQPGLVTRGDSQITTGGNIRIVGPTDTLFESTEGAVNLEVNAGGTAFVQVDDILFGALRGAIVRASGSISFIADRVFSAGPGAAVELSLLGPGQVFARVNSLETTRPFSPGIQVFAGQGDVRLELGTVATRSNFTSPPGTLLFVPSPGVRVFGRGVSIDVASVSTFAQLSPGIQVTALGNAAIVSGSVTTTRIESNGMEITAAGTLSIASGRVTVSAPGSAGIIATGNGNVNIASQAMEVTGPVYREIISTFSMRTVIPVGIRATSSTGDVVVTSGSLTATQSRVDGIVAFASQGNVTVSAGTTRSAGTAISGNSNGGNVMIQADTVSAGTVGIIATAGSGSAFVDVGNVFATGLSAVGIHVASGRASTVTIRGTASVAAQGFATVLTRGGPATLNILPGGTLSGRVDLGSGADRVNNSGIFDAIGSSAFGDGADLFDNSAAGIVRSVNGAAAFAGLESFGNGGLIELRDGVAGDSLALAGYAGVGGGRLGVDVDFTTLTADRLFTGAATGSTLIDIRPLGDSTVLASGILLVDAGTGTSPTAFALAPGTGNVYLRDVLRFDAANNDFLLDRSPGTAAFETARFGAMATQLWYESADAVAAQLDTGRDGRRGRGISLWLQGWTGERSSVGSPSLTGAGTLDVSFQQDFQGLQGGVDLQTGAVAVGITGGAGRSDATFLATGNPVDMEVRNIGAYLQGRSGLLFFNALAKYDWAELEIAPGAGLGASFDADLFGIQTNAGVRLGFGRIFAEPSVGLSWVNSEVDAFASGPATIGPGRGESLRARAGLRVGARLPVGGGALLPFVAVNAYEELSGEHGSDFTLGETLRLFDEPPGTRGQAAAGVSFVAGSFEAFVRGDIDFSGESDSKSVRAGARLRF